MAERNKKIVATIECRMASTRLPGKVLLPAVGRPFLQILVERLRKVKRLDDIVIATTENEPDNAIVELAKKINCKYFRGSEEDVLGRVLGAVHSVDGDIVVEITGDCPFIDPEIISQTIKLYLNNDCDYCSNVVERSFPRGMDTQVFSVEALEKANRKGLTPSDREHVSYYILQHPNEFKLLGLPCPKELFWPELRLTLDEISDYKLLGIIQAHFSGQGRDYPSCLEIVNYLKQNLHLKDINKHVVQKSPKADSGSSPVPQSQDAKYSALVLGLGNIGFGYDVESHDYVLTHTKAYLNNKKTHLIAGIDIEQQRREVFINKTKKPAYSTLVDFKKANKQNIDIISVCTPTETLCEVAGLCLSFAPKVIILEKPIAYDIEQARRIVELCRAKEVALFVNYIRRCDALSHEIKKIIKDKVLGDLLFGFVYYSRGVYANACHFIDLINFWLDNAPAQVSYVSNFKKRGKAGDFSACFGLECGDVEFYFTTSSRADYVLSEYDLFFSKGRIRFSDNGFFYETYRKQQSPYFKNNLTLTAPETSQRLSMLNYQANVLNHIVDYLEGRAELLSTGETSLATLKTIEKIKSYDTHCFT